jgi:hypothetical protein
LSEHARGEEEKSELQQAVTRLLEGCPNAYSPAKRWAIDISSTIADQLARSIAPLLNSHLSTMPQTTLAEKRELAIWINAELRDLGLCIRCPKTGLPGLLYADFKDSQNDGVSRFRIESRRASGRRTETSVFKTLPELGMMPEPVRDIGRTRTMGQ